MNRSEIIAKINDHLQKYLESWNRGNYRFNLETNYVDDLDYDFCTEIEYQIEVLELFKLSGNFINTDAAMEKIKTVGDMVGYIEGVLNG